jgi:hypothetical protein
MARCGCQGSCSCVVQGVAPISVTGNGSVQQPYIITLAMNGQTGCAAITACVAANLGPGLVYDPGTGDIQLRLSTDDGNTLTFGTDEGVKNLAGVVPAPVACVTGISSLPAAPDVVMAQDLGGLQGAYSSPRSLDRSIADGNDMHLFHVATNAGDVGVVSDYSDHKVTTGRTNIYIGQDIRQLNTSTVTSLYNYAGDYDDPISYNPGDGTVDRTDRRGGWYGNLEPRYYQPLVTDFLDKIHGHGVAVLDCTVDPVNGVYPEATSILGAVRGVLEYCAQAWAMIAVAEIATATTVLNAGITPALLPQPRPTTWGTTTLPYAVADLTAAGIEWLFLSDRYADSVFTTYRAAGFQVLMLTNSRHQQRARVEALGIRGASCYDPVYYRGPLVGDWPYGYRSETDAWEHRRMALGQLTFATDGQSVLSSGGFVRGRNLAAEQGLQLPAGFGNGLGRPGVLLGWLCPLTAPTNYLLEWDMKWDTLATNSATRAKMGVLFGAATDRDVFDWPVGDATQNPVGYPEGQKTLYRAYQRQNGELGIAKWASQASDITYLATTTSPAMVADAWNHYALRVTPTQITLTRTAPNGTNYTVTAADAQYRGGYVWAEKEESFNGSPANPFVGMFRSFAYDSTP